MKKLAAFLFIFSLAFLSNGKAAHAFAKGAEQECSKCHTLNDEQAKEAIKDLGQDIKILQINPAAIKGLWEIGVEAGGRKGIVYLDYSKKKVILGGNILDLQTKRNFTKETFDKINKVDVSQIPLENSIVMGPKDAKNKVVVFDDPE